MSLPEADADRVVGIHTIADKPAAIAKAHCIIVGGGNTFSLLCRCQEEGLLAPIRAAVASGAKYVGWSAGANLACPTIKTTNDMPIEAPAGLEA
ncbi:MAG: Type 1 glutamine amidotransferase-like domain-containing protein, partial [Kofleriaceae bacterium]|nr:Type 1 glutamine amidotransferase-like domain-containing protein [Kofleriaceae bacterium]